MPQPHPSPDPSQILTVAQMRAAEQALIDDGTDVVTLMERAGQGAGEWVRRIAAGRPVTVLCGPGNNGGDGWVIARFLAERGMAVTVVEAMAPGTDAARHARSHFAGRVVGPDAQTTGAILVDCLFGSGLSRPLAFDVARMLRRLAASHPYRIAVDVPSGVDSGSGAMLNDELPTFDLTLALGAWKPAHFTMPAAATMGALRLVDIGVVAVSGAAHLLAKPQLSAPAADAHKYRRGLLGIVGGAMPGAAVLAATAALRAGAGYVQLLCPDDAPPAVPPELVVRHGPLHAQLEDGRHAALLIGPGLGRDGRAGAKLRTALDAGVPLVLDADALVLLRPGMMREGAAVLTPHEGEMQVLERQFALSGHASRGDRASALAAATGAVVILKGPDSMIATPQGAVTMAPRASSWLSVAGSGDVLAGTVASRLAVTRDPARAAHEGLWLHGAAARLAAPAFTTGMLAEAIRGAMAEALA